MAVQSRGFVGTPGVSGGFYSGDLGTALPTDTKTALDKGFKIVSAVSDDGVKETVDRKTDDIRQWSGSMFRMLQSEYTLTVKLTFIERTDASLKETFGPDNVTVKDNGDGTRTRTVLFNESMLPARSYVADLRDGDKHLRKVYPNAQITDIGDVSYKAKELIAYEVTITCYQDEHGQFGYEYEQTPDGETSKPIGG